MKKSTHDPGLDALLALDGVVLVVDPDGAHWVKIIVKQVAPSAERPHVISYSLTLRAANGARLVGYDLRTLSAREPGRGGGETRRTINATGTVRQSPMRSATRKR